MTDDRKPTQKTSKDETIPVPPKRGGFRDLKKTAADAIVRRTSTMR
jgi:hypothetical protein